MSQKDGSYRLFKCSVLRVQPSSQTKIKGESVKAVLYTVPLSLESFLLLMKGAMKNIFTKNGMNKAFHFCHCRLDSRCSIFTSFTIPSLSLTLLLFPIHLYLSSILIYYHRIHNLIMMGLRTLCLTAPCSSR